jgi:ribosome-binding ATPase YchF (GTP1/OBG family)
LARLVPLDEDEEKLMEELSLLTGKPVIYVANVSENALDERSQKHLKEIFDRARDNQAEVVIVAAKFESELAKLESEERKEFLREEGLEESGLERFIKASYQLLDLVTFFTTVGPEVRAWTVKRGTRAPQAAGKVHSDMEKGFIRAEVVSYADLMAAGSLAKARELGVYGLGGKEYVVQDGDVIYFRFAV